MSLTNKKRKVSDMGIKRLNNGNYYIRLLMDTDMINNGYHNINHTVTVLSNASFYMSHILKDKYHNDLGNEDGWREAKIVALSAIFHDANHSGGKFKDDVNIDRAIKFMRDNLLPEDKDVEEQIADTIRGTQYPYVIVDEDLTIYQQVLRDADLSQAFDINSLYQQVVIGLAKELNISIDESIQSSIKFWNGVTKFYTKSGNMRLEVYKPIILEVLESLLITNKKEGK